MLHLHSLLRYVVLILLLAAIVFSGRGWLTGKAFRESDLKIGLYLMIATHLQLLLGLYLYFVNGWATFPMAESMKDDVARFWKLEHITGMVFAVVLITLGRMRSKKVEGDMRKHRISFIFYTLALIIILASIPWEVGRMY